MLAPWELRVMTCVFVCVAAIDASSLSNECTPRVKMSMRLRARMRIKGESEGED